MKKCFKTVKLTENQKKPHMKFLCCFLLSGFIWKMTKAHKQAESSDEDENSLDSFLLIRLLNEKMCASEG